jgi:hypothetical protein
MPENEANDDTWIEEDDIDRIPIINKFRQMPLFDNVFLNMQAMNVALVDDFIRKQERLLLNLYIEIERTLRLRRFSYLP